ncbi:MAG: sigma-70 family RNA polymerase sigma factor [Clostridia bacterium]|nr:sigma-70 family RNA polymerase sigma factor [Clostridia bacterium]
MDKEKMDRQRFIEENFGLVHAICKRFIGRGIEYDDLYQAGCIGLIKATDAFDQDRGVCFSTYAVPVILGEVRRMFRDGGLIKVSRSVKELARKISYAQEEQKKTLGRDPTVGELATLLSVSQEEITEAIGILQPTLSLTCADEDGIGEYDVPTEGIEEQLADKLYLEEAFLKLGETERKIISCRYFHALTQSKTAEILGMSQVQISRMERKILAHLKTLLSSA